MIWKCFQTPWSVKAMFKDPCIWLASEVSKVLIELSNSIRNCCHCSLEILSDHLQKYSLQKYSSLNNVSLIQRVIVLFLRKNRQRTTKKNNEGINRLIFVWVALNSIFRFYIYNIMYFRFSTLCTFLYLYFKC